MIEFVFWSCLLGVTPIALEMGSRVLTPVARLACRFATRLPAFFHDEQVAPGFGPHSINHARGFGYGGRVHA